MHFQGRIGVKVLGMDADGSVCLPLHPLELPLPFETERAARSTRDCSAAKDRHQSHQTKSITLGFVLRFGESPRASW